MGSLTVTDAPHRVVAAPGAFGLMASAREVADAVDAAARSTGWTCDRAPLADGGAGTLDALGGQPYQTRVTGPLGDPIEAEWCMRGASAVVEMARASGLSLVGGPEANDAMQATTYGTGQLIAAALERGARRVIVGLGGSATTDGGLGALRALGHPQRRLHRVELVAACDVTTTFVEAAEAFAPQKGATPAQVALLRRRLERLAQVYERDYGVDVRRIRGSGAAGGLGGALAAIGARLLPGALVVADAIGLVERLATADLVVTGEAFVDQVSLEERAVGAVLRAAAEAGVPALVVAGDIEPGLDLGAATTVRLTGQFDPGGGDGDPLGLVRESVAAELTARSASGPPPAG